MFFFFLFAFPDQVFFTACSFCEGLAGLVSRQIYRQTGRQAMTAETIASRLHYSYSYRYRYGLALLVAFLHRSFHCLPMLFSQYTCVKSLSSVASTLVMCFACRGNITASNSVTFLPSFHFLLFSFPFPFPFPRNRFRFPPPLPFPFLLPPFILCCAVLSFISLRLLFAFNFTIPMP